MTSEELQQAAARGTWLITYFCSERIDLDDALVGAAEQGEAQLKAFIDAQVGAPT